MNDAKNDVKNFWDEASCGEALYLRDDTRESYEDQARARYELEPWIISFADFESSRDKKVLEIGVGLGSDHQRFAEAGADLHGIDLTERAINHVKKRFFENSLISQLNIGDAENLSFKDSTFDIVYSYGVLHHTPNTTQAIKEVYRVLKPGGIARIMIYHKWSIVGFMLWIRYGLLAFRPFMGLAEIYDRYLESPGTKAYSVSEAKKLFCAFTDVEIDTFLSHADLLESGAGQRHGGIALRIARRIWPRKLIRMFLPKMGLPMLIVAKK